MDAGSKCALNQIDPAAVRECVTPVAIKMHSSFGKAEAFTESRDIIGSIWTKPPFEKNAALSWLQIHLCAVVRRAEVTDLSTPGIGISCFGWAQSVSWLHDNLLLISNLALNHG
jgi:hypothetical protein